MSSSELPELAELEHILAEGAPYLQSRVVSRITVGGHCFPIYVITLGNPSRQSPAIGFFGGVHGLERIGAEVVISYLRSLVMRLRWDELLHRQLESVRLVFMPLINPGGVWQGSRANPNGVDLMRNAPLEANDGVPFLLGGQRFSKRLPWYRGALHAPMEVESLALCQVVQEELMARDFSLALDCHSGFGITDRIWFPYAHCVRPIMHVPEVHALKKIFDQTNSHHDYVFEPQSRQYRTHGDLWDYLYLRSSEQKAKVFLPLTLEMGSWLWVKKNPRQLFSRHGIFNPLIEHRLHRVLRRHLALFDCLTRAAGSHRSWMPVDEMRDTHHKLALELWYRKS